MYNIETKKAKNECIIVKLIAKEITISQVCKLTSLSKRQIFNS